VLIWGFSGNPVKNWRNLWVPRNPGWKTLSRVICIDPNIIKLFVLCSAKWIRFFVILNLLKIIETLDRRWNDLSIKRHQDLIGQNSVPTFFTDSLEQGFSTLGRFHQHIYAQFYMHRSHKYSKTVKSSVSFALLGSASAKAGCKTLIKWSPGKSQYLNSGREQ